jgi:3-oxoacyl-(acyl-carrier-protein) synthase
VRRLSVLAVFTAAFAACGGSAAVTRAPIVFGITGGNIAPYRVSIQPDGTVRGAAHRQIPSARVRRLQQEIEQAHLTSRRCNGTLADVASQYISVSGRTVTVHGACEPSFERVWHDLAQAAGVRRG